MAKQKNQHEHLFDDEWLERARNHQDPDSWATQVLEDSTRGQAYLRTLGQWFGAYPLKTDDKKKMAGQLQNLANEAHLGAVNELVWWQLMKRMDWEAEPVPCKKGVYTPDFLVRHPHRLYVEVTTENVSDKDRNTDVRPFDHKETARRLLNIVSSKKGQLCAAAAESQPIALAVFDYTAWSGLGAEVARGIAEYVVCPDKLRATIPAEASAIVFVLSQFDGERFRVGVDQSAVYHNPVATHPLPESVFSWFPQYRFTAERLSPNAPAWICL